MPTRRFLQPTREPLRPPENTWLGFSPSGEREAQRNRGQHVNRDKQIAAEPKVAGHSGLSCELSFNGSVLAATVSNCGGTVLQTVPKLIAKRKSEYQFAQDSCNKLRHHWSSSINFHTGDANGAQNEAPYCAYVHDAACLR
jgi:hypothetical protein